MKPLPIFAAAALLIAVAPALAQEELSTQSKPAARCEAEPLPQKAVEMLFDNSEMTGAGPLDRLLTGSIAPPVARTHGH